MNCTEACNLADDYVFDLLEPAVAQGLAEHIDSCEACSKVVEEARARRKLLGAWQAAPPAGAADRLLARIQAGDISPRRRRAAYGRLLVRVLASAAVILAALVLPRVFLIEQPRLGGFVPQFTSVEGEFRRSVRQEFNIPQDFAASAYILVCLKSVDDKSPVEAAIRLNEDERGPILTAAAASEEVYMLAQERGLKEGRNVLVLENLGSGPLEFEVTLVTGKGN